ncbi:uncharacterized protein LOC105207055 isoform X3 [Solenopsis invicta]|nr:uncharacterized protein LOC105207055 isoform X3 [Solenopsis invicta]
MKKRHKGLQNKYKKRIKDLEKKVGINENFAKTIQQLLHKDQIQLLNKTYKKIPKWCNATLIKAFQLKFACGYSGYKELLNKGFPFPCIRTLNRKLENLKFRSGILDEIFQFLNLKVSQFINNTDRDCLLILDEISITPGIVFDTSTYTYIGKVTLPNHDQNEIATHCLVFMLAGIGKRWKQVVAYYYTSNRTDGSIYKEIIVEIIKKAEKINLYVHGVISDMAASNQAMWRAFNIQASKYSTVQNKCIHPCDQNRYLFFFHDSMHAFKNFKEGMLNHKFITIPDKYVKKYQLPTDTAQAEHFQELFHQQKDFLLSLGLFVLLPFLN